MKICLIGPVYPFRGGIAHFTTQLVGYFRQDCHEVSVFSFRRQYPAWLYPGKTDKDNSAQVSSVEAKFLLDAFNPLSWLVTGKQILAEKPDAVIIMWWTTFWAPSMGFLSAMFRRKGLKVIFLIHNVMPHEAKPWDRQLAGLGLRNGSSFLTMTEKEATRLRAILPDARIAVSPHPVYEFFERDSISKEKAREQLDLPINEKVILFFGIVRPYKGLRHLLEAVAYLQEKQSVHLLVAGEFWEPEQDYISMIHQLGISDLVHIFGRYIPNEEVPVFFKAADIFVAPYTGGTQSGAVKVAMGFQLPIVVTPIILDETLSKTANVVTATDHSPVNLAEAIERAIGLPESAAVDIKESGWENMVQVLRSL